MCSGEELADHSGRKREREREKKLEREKTKERKRKREKTKEKKRERGKKCDWYSTAGIQLLVFNSWYSTASIQQLVFNSLYSTAGIQQLVFNSWYSTAGIQQLVFKWCSWQTKANPLPLKITVKRFPQPPVDVRGFHNPPVDVRGFHNPLWMSEVSTISLWMSEEEIERTHTDREKEIYRERKREKQRSYPHKQRSLTNSAPSQTAYESFAACICDVQVGGSSLHTALEFLLLVTQETSQTIFSLSNSSSAPTSLYLKLHYSGWEHQHDFQDVTGGGLGGGNEYYSNDVQKANALPECATQQVCNAVYVRLNMTQPLCSCPALTTACSASMSPDDKHTIELKMGRKASKAVTLIKTCEPVWSVRDCRAPRDWSILALQNTRTGKAHYLVICKCPDGSKLDGPLNHDQPSYAQVPGIRVYGMMCVSTTLRAGRYTRETASFPWSTAEAALADQSMLDNLFSEEDPVADADPKNTQSASTKIQPATARFLDLIPEQKLMELEDLAYIPEQELMELED
ncbi:hypothetical protein FHG87_011087 [Trinorchestia longiramus]|nr:hypothetical protein FHG87_011087 [Trinorchestia longiramus]